MYKECKKHGLAHHSNKTGICRLCNTQARSKARRKVKLTLINLLGGQCIICGYNKCIAALEFHHLDRQNKKFVLAGFVGSLKRAMEEAEKCAILCANCHREVEVGTTKFPENYTPKKLEYIEKIKVKKEVDPNWREKTRKVNRPNLKTLLDNIQTLGYVQTGKLYGVSDNAIRNWVKYYNKYGELV